MKKKPQPIFKIGDYVGTKPRSNQWSNSWYEDGSKVASISYGCAPYSNSESYYPGPQFLYTLENGNIIGEHSIKPLDR